MGDNESSTTGGVSLGILSLITILVGLIEVFSTRDLWLIVPYAILIVIQWLLWIVWAFPVINIAGLPAITYIIMPLWQDFGGASPEMSAIIAFSWFVIYGLALLLYYGILLFFILGGGD